MATLNALDPTPEQIAAFLGHPKAGQPVFMLNLLKFKDKATYKEDRPEASETLSGRAAYARYAKGFGAMLKSRNIDGVETVFGGNANAFLIGGGQGAKVDGQEWDAVAIVRYANASAMFEAVSNDDYKAIHYHRRAGLAGQLLIACDNEKVFK